MNQNKLDKLIKSKIITVPLYALKRFQDFNLPSNALVLLFYLYNQDNCAFDPGLIAENLNMDLLKVMESVSILSDNGLINLITKKNELGIKEEILDLSPLYNKIEIKVMEALNKSCNEEMNLYGIVEEEFNRKLKPSEYETIDNWLKNDYSKDLVKEALKEATLNGVNSLRYVDKILFDWQKKGYHEPQDIKKKDEQEEKIEIFSCDWLDTDETI